MFGLSFSPRISVPLTAADHRVAGGLAATGRAGRSRADDAGAGPAFDDCARSLRRPDDADRAGRGRDEVGDGGDLGLHAALAELAGRDVGAGLSTVMVSSHCCSGVPKRMATRGTAVGMSSMSAPRFVGEQAAGEVLVHDGFHADERAVGLDGHRDAAAARRDDHGARVEQQADGFGLDDSAADAATAPCAASRGRRPP